jgi:hypothetical protein
MAEKLCGENKPLWQREGLSWLADFCFFCIIQGVVV